LRRRVASGLIILLLRCGLREAGGRMEVEEGKRCEKKRETSTNSSTTLLLIDVHEG
jgi:hypothetical protein